MPKNCPKPKLRVVKKSNPDVPDPEKLRREQWWGILDQLGAVGRIVMDAGESGVLEDRVATEVLDSLQEAADCIIGRIPFSIPGRLP